jgi:hypothetical protein
VFIPPPPFAAAAAAAHCRSCSLLLLLTAAVADCWFCRCHAAAYLPLNPVPVTGAPPDIFPGLSGSLNISADEWNSYGLQIPPNATLLYEYNQGREDAAAWVVAYNLSELTAVQRALADTQLPMMAVNTTFPLVANATGSPEPGTSLSRQGHRLLAVAKTERQGWGR